MLGILRLHRADEAPALATDVGPAEQAWQQHLADLAAVQAEQSPLNTRLAEFQAVIAQDEGDRQQLAALASQHQQLRADVLVGTDRTVELQDLEGQLAAIRRRIDARADEATVTRIAAQKLQAQIDALASRMGEIRERHAGYAHALLVERLAAEASTYGDALAVFLAQHQKVTALATAADRLGPRVPGTRSLDAGAGLRLEINFPSSPAFKPLAAKRDIRRAVLDEATELLAVLQIRA